MEPKKFTQFLRFSISLLLLNMAVILLHAQPGKLKVPGEQHFVFSFGTGYGISNIPSRESDKETTGGAVIGFSLGYKVNNRLTIDFGPSFWIEGKDIINKNAADKERPNNKRTTVTFGGTFHLFSQFPLTARLAAGAGILNYTPDRNVVSRDEAKFDKTEIFKGYSIISGLGYEMRLSQRLKLHPQINFWYIKLEDPETGYTSFTDPSQPSLTGEFRLNLNYHF